MKESELTLNSEMHVWATFSFTHISPGLCRTFSQFSSRGCRDVFTARQKLRFFLTIIFVHSRKYNLALGAIRATPSNPALLYLPCENHPLFQRKHLSYIPK